MMVLKQEYEILDEGFGRLSSMVELYEPKYIEMSRNTMQLLAMNTLYELKVILSDDVNPFDNIYSINGVRIDIHNDYRIGLINFVYEKEEIM